MSIPDIALDELERGLGEDVRSAPEGNAVLSISDNALDELERGLRGDDFSLSQPALNILEELNPDGTENQDEMEEFDPICGDVFASTPIHEGRMRYQRLDRDQQQRRRRRRGRNYRRMENPDYDQGRIGYRDWNRRKGLCVNEHGDVANCSSLLKRYAYKRMHLYVNEIPLTLLMSFQISIEDAREITMTSLRNYILRIVPYVRDIITTHPVISANVVMRFINNMGLLYTNLNNIRFRGRDGEDRIAEIIGKKYSQYVKDLNLREKLQELLTALVPTEETNIIPYLKEILKTYNEKSPSQIEGFITDERDRSKRVTRTRSRRFDSKPINTQVPFFEI